ncbi:Pkr1-domain-containing protein [Pseudovirgaria hyperparasitica]|uniref:Pkr1-domain-containing protein n=1 Tax=Pseudovirgaria hyperparasitica TaxID=470096 RepID=A0A6A6W7Q7_9PEZI|nr:Pkr1-domain-containing protein [Pseudovirgaria hyperparasitica]KAF2758239.1 Pkr1-domain-containing protein [Pseudovirgaria hyperparasitica]
MSEFFTSLWESIFTPGPTPTLLIATNATFGALSLLLVTLLVATQSIHFLILSILSGGLWWAINWFATELRAAQAKEEEAKQIRRRSREKDISLGNSGPGVGAIGGDGEGMDSGDDTETEIDERLSKEPQAVLGGSGVQARNSDTQGQLAGQRGHGYGSGDRSTAAQTSLIPPRDEGMKKRRSMAESDASLSTDSEWEKVEEE